MIVNRMSRKLSWLLAALAYLGPPVWAHWAVTADQNAQRTAYGFVKCATPHGMIALWACAVSGLLSLLAIAFALATYRLVPSPRPKPRVLEIGAVAAPALVAGLVFASLFWD